MILRWKQSWKNIWELHLFCPNTHIPLQKHVHLLERKRYKDFLWDFWFPLWQTKNLEITLPSYCCWNKFHKSVTYNNTNLLSDASGGQNSEISFTELKANSIISIWSRNINPGKQGCESIQHFTFILEILAWYFFSKQKLAHVGEQVSSQTIDW